MAVASCNGSDSSWPQLHGDGSGQGSLLEPTEFALHPAWEFTVGPFDSGKPTSSPVIGDDGTIYIGNLDGDIIAVSPAGAEQWRATSPFEIFAAPAVGGDGTVYAIGTAFFPDAEFPDHTFRSTLMTIASDGTVLNLTLLPDQGFTASAPRVVTSSNENWLFVHAHTRRRFLNRPSSALLVFDGRGDLVARQDLGCSRDLTSGPSIFDLLEDLVDLITVEFDESGPPGDADDYGPPDPTVAVVEAPEITGQGITIVVVAEQVCANVTALQWNPTTGTLSRFWFVDEGEDFEATSSPAIVNASQVVIGRRDGSVSSYDLDTGNERWTYDAGEPVLGTPAALLRHVYIASTRHVHALDPADGKAAFKRGFSSPGTFASPVVSASKVHLGTGAEFLSFDLGLEVVSHDDDAAFGRPAASPAIARDGSVYTVTVRPDRGVVLVAYPG